MAAFLAGSTLVALIALLPPTGRPAQQMPGKDMPADQSGESGTIVVRDNGTNGITFIGTNKTISAGTTTVSAGTITVDAPAAPAAQPAGADGIQHLESSAQINLNTPEGRQIANQITGIDSNSDKPKILLFWRDGRKIFQVTAKPDQNGAPGLTLFEGPVDTDKEQAEIPKAYRHQFDMVWIVGKIALAPGAKPTPAQEKEQAEARKALIKATDADFEKNAKCPMLAPAEVKGEVVDLDAKTPAVQPAETDEDTLTAKLDCKNLVQMNFGGESLESSLLAIQACSGIPLAIQWDDIEKAGIKRSAKKITVAIRNAALKDALHAVLDAASAGVKEEDRLIYVVKNGTVHIAPRSVLEPAKAAKEAAPETPAAR